MFNSDSPSTAGKVPFATCLLICLLASCAALLFTTHYKNRAQLTQAVPAQVEGVPALKMSRSVRASDGQYLSFVIAEETRLQKRLQDRKQKYDEPAPGEQKRLDYLADYEARLQADLEKIGDQLGLASGIQEKLEDTRYSIH